MLKLHFQIGGKREFKVLCLGAHADDIEIGCGGTILRLLAEHRNLVFYWVVFSATEERELEARKSASLFLKGVRQKTVSVKDFRNSFFPFVGSELKEYFEQIKDCFSPDLVFTHYREDRHQDHCTISDLTWNTFRDHLILEYEIPKYDGDLGSPNVFSRLDETICRKKTRHLLHTFRSQKENHWFTEETFRSLMRLRGIECNSPQKYAEAFYCRKLVL